MSLRDFKIYRGDDNRGELVNYKCKVTEGMVVLDVIHRIRLIKQMTLRVDGTVKLVNVDRVVLK